VVPVGEARPRREEFLRGRVGREGRGLRVGRQQQGRRRAVFLFMDMDKALGGEFEKGLASVKSAAEASARR
jgi:hypothetical protein